MNKKGFTLFELLACIVVIIFAFFLAIPIVLNIIKGSRLKSFKDSALNTLDAIEIDLAKNDFKGIGSNGIEIQNVDSSILKNNNFDDGLVVRNNELLEFVYLKQGDYCARGNKNNLIATDKGCGALDETAPTKAYVFYKTGDNNYSTIVVSGYDPDSSIISYELSIDGESYISNKDKSYNVFNIEISDNNIHTFKAKITNEAGLTLESDVKEFKRENNPICSKDKKNIKCTPNNLSYSKDLNNWNKFMDYKPNNEDIYFKNNGSFHLLSIKNVNNVLNKSVPKLDDNMIPVIFKEGKWIVADSNSRYYDYLNNNWANAVVVRKKKDNNDPNSNDRSYYLTSEAIGSEINPSDILAFYVWIPKYDYKLWNVNGKNVDINSIDITFENSEIQKGVKNGIETNDMWYTHPAFLYEDGINGYWVSKYPMSAEESSSCYAFNNPENCDNSNYNIYSNNTNKLTNISLYNAYTISKNMTLKNNVYGLNNSESHLLTNLEWGSIIYLANSRYGINSQIVNSTTGNETGVYYDSSINEMVMANYSNRAKKLNIDEEVFIDNYNSSTSKGRILGDATLETEAWGDNENKFINGSIPFMIRGKNSPYSYEHFDGKANSEISFRTVLYVK